MVERMIITAQSWPAVMDELSKEVERALDSSSASPAHQKAFMVFLNTLRELTRLEFDYLPEAERKKIVVFCAAWLDIGLLFGKCPQVLIDILTRAEATGILSDEAE